MEDEIKPMNDRITKLLDETEGTHGLYGDGSQRQRLIAALREALPFIQYIADSPPREHGGFSDEAIANAKSNLNRIADILEGKKHE